MGCQIYSFVKKTYGGELPNVMAFIPNCYQHQGIQDVLTVKTQRCGTSRCTEANKGERKNSTVNCAS